MSEEGKLKYMLGETLISGWFYIIFNIIGNNSLLIYKSICV